MKAFFSTLIGFIVIIVVAAVIVGFITWSRVPDMIANTLSKKLKVSVAINDMSLGWGKIDIEKIDVANVPHSILAKAFSCDLIRVLTPFTHYLDKKIVINEIDMNNVYLGLEFDSATSTRGNWTEIMKNINPEPGQPAQGKKGKKAEAAPAPSSDRSVLIHKLILTNIRVDVVYKKEGGKVKHLPPIDRLEFTEISSEGGLPTDQIMNSVLGKMLKSVFEKENLNNMLQDLFDKNNPVQQFIQPFKGLFQTIPKDADDALLPA